MIGTLVNVLDPIAIFLLDTTIKTTLFMGLVLLAVWLLDTRQAAKRSLLLNWCLVGVLVIPIASLCMPSLRFQFDAPSFPSELAVPPVQPVIAPDKPLTKSTPVLKQQKESTKALSQDIEFSQNFVSPPPAQIVFAKNASTKSIDWTAYILNKITSAQALYGVIAVYAIGLLILLIRVIYCLIMVCTFRQSLLPCADEQLQNNLQVLKNQLGIRRSVALAISDKIGSPTQVGLLKPLVVLPAPMVESRDQLKSILIHELIHVKRWDCLYRLLAMVGLAFYWFNPLYHRVKHLLFEVQEQACDDWTVTTTGNSESYADTLLNVATQLRPRPAMALGMDMARATQVMARVNRIITLGGHVSPRVGRVSALVMAVVFIGGATAIGSLTTSKVDHNDQKVVFEGGVAVTDTSDVSQRTLPMKMRDGRMWWRGENGLYLQDGDAWQKFTLPEGGSFDQIHAFMQARNGSMWFAGIYKNGPIVVSFSGKTWQIWDSKTTGLGKITAGYDFAEDEDGGIWISHHGMGNIRAYGGADRFKGGNGVLHFDGKAWRNYTLKDGLIHNRVYNVEADPKGGVWIATLRGLSHYKDGKWTSHIVDSMPIEGVRNGNIYDGHKVYKLFSDQKGTLWAAHGSTIGRTITRHISGISSFDGTAWTHYDAHVGLPVNAYRNIWQTKNGDLWFGTHQGDQQKVETKGLVRYKDGMWLRFTRKHGIPGDFVWGLTEKGDGSFYLGVSGSVSYKPPIDHLSTISGKVIDQRDGKPAANMGIWVEYDDGEVHAGTTTDENGRYRVEVTPGSYRVRIASKNAAEPVTVNAKPEDKIEDIDLLLLNSRRISGRVLDKFDNPIANAVVVISDDSSEDRRVSPQIVTTDANGKFEGWQVSGPKATFDVAAEGYAQIVREVENAIEEQVVISLKKGKTFRGRVVDELGTPIAWARVGLGPPPDPEKKVYTLPALPFQRNTYTDASGLFTLNDVAEGHIWVNHPETGMVNQEVMPAQDVTDIRIERLRLYSVSGVVSLTGVPVERLRVSTTALNGAKSRPQVGRPDANGAYRQEGLEPGKYHIAVLAPEKEEREGRTIAIHRNVQSQVLVIKDRDVILNFEPLGDARITGVATYKGQPVSDVAISVQTIGDDPEIFVSLNGKKTDKEGRFELRGLPSARITISFRKMERLVLGGKRWSKVDRIDLTNKKELNYIAELDLEERPILSLGDIAPEFEAKQLDGSTFRLSDYRGEKAVLIDFWATWCPPCIEEIPTIKRIADTYRDRGLEVVGVSLDRDEKVLRDFVKREKLSYVQVFEKEKTRAITKSYGVWGMPSVFLIDKDGVINAIKLRGTRTEAAVKALLDTGLQTADGNSR
ncbi:MAG: carboxypeptidase regulatory-like domain-containing protein [Gemmatimonadota bacterium]|nr:carboxypeptidase regulatory-like domain-containing protein [Gemmatimonadota bacterium]